MPELRIPQGIIDALPHVRAAASALPQCGEILVQDISYVRRGGKPVPVLRAAPGPDLKGRLWVIGDPDSPIGTAPMYERAMADRDPLVELAVDIEGICDALECALAVIDRQRALGREIEDEDEGAARSVLASGGAVERVREHLASVVRSGSPTDGAS